MLSYSDSHLHKRHLAFKDLLGGKSQAVNPDPRKETGNVEREMGRGAEEKEQANTQEQRLTAHETELTSECTRKSAGCVSSGSEAQV